MTVEHDFYKSGDKDAPEQIRDGAGGIALSLCKVCDQAEGELEPTCPGPSGRMVRQGKPIENNHEEDAVRSGTGDWALPVFWSEGPCDDAIMTADNELICTLSGATDAEVHELVKRINVGRIDPKQWTLFHDGRRADCDNLAQVMAKGRELRTEAEKITAAQNLQRAIATELVQQDKDDCDAMCRLMARCVVRAHDIKMAAGGWEVEDTLFFNKSIETSVNEACAENSATFLNWPVYAMLKFSYAEAMNWAKEFNK